MQQRELRRAVLVIVPVLTVGGLWMTAGPGAGRDGGAAAAAPAWRQLPSGEPLFGHTLVADGQRERIVVVGGELADGGPPEPPLQLDLTTDAWGAWTVGGQPPVSSRVGRGVLGAAAALHEVQSVVLAVCDCRDGGTYELDLTIDLWSAAPGAAGGRVVSAGLVVDSESERAVAFGGREFGITDILTRTQAYDLSAARSGWSALPDLPFQLQDQAVAMAPEERAGYAFGGQTMDGDAAGVLWRVDLTGVDGPGAWLALEAEGPAARMGATLTSVGPGQAVLFGGYAEGAHFGDVWRLDASDPAAPRWSRLVVPEPAPEPRAAHGAAWDPLGRRLIVYGGITGVAPDLRVLDDAWALYLDGAPPASPTAPPAPTVAQPTPDATETPAPEPRAPVYLPLALRNGGL